MVEDKTMENKAVPSEPAVEKDNVEAKDQRKSFINEKAMKAEVNALFKHFQSRNLTSLEATIVCQEMQTGLMSGQIGHEVMSRISKQPVK